MKPLYSLKNITLKYPLAETNAGNDAVIALDNISLDIYENEYLAILGGNGSGKSTLAKLLAGLAGRFTGEIQYRGELVKDYDRDVFSDVAMILQEPQNQILMPAVWEEIAFALENRKLPPDQISKKVDSIAKQFNLGKFLDRKTDQLSGGQITSLALATALVTEPNVIILDEPDSHLDNESRLILQDFIKLKRGKITIIVISQFPDSVKYADRCLVLDKGKRLFLGSAKQLFEDNSLKEKSGLFPVGPKARIIVDTDKVKTPKTSGQKPILTLIDVSYSYTKNSPVLKKINLEIYPKDKVGLIGLSGAGKSTLGLLIAGLLQPDSGEILLNDTPIRQLPSRQLRKAVAISMQFPERALVGHTVAEDVAFGPENLGLDDLDLRLERHIQQFNLAELRERHPFTLSGGQKRRAALAGIFAMETPVVILDEPTAAMDPQKSAALMEWLLADEKHTYIIISHDLKFIKLVSDYRIGLKDGEICKPDIF